MDATRTSEDFLFRARQNSDTDDSATLTEHATLSALHAIRRLWSEHGSSLDAFPGLPSLPVNFEPLALVADTNTPNLVELHKLVARNVTLLNPSQRRVFDAIIAAIDTDTTAVPRPPRLRAHSKQVAKPTTGVSGVIFTGATLYAHTTGCCAVPVQTGIRFLF